MPALRCTGLGGLDRLSSSLGCAMSLRVAIPAHQLPSPPALCILAPCRPGLPPPPRRSSPSWTSVRSSRCSWPPRAWTRTRSWPLCARWQPSARCARRAARQAGGKGLSLCQGLPPDGRKACPFHPAEPPPPPSCACPPTQDELRDVRAPRVFSLTKIVEIAHFNMGRIRWERRG
jgi:hypothetical protein